MSKSNGQHHEKPEHELLSVPVPVGWARTTVGEAGQVRLGRQRSPKNRSSKHPTKYIRAANVTWNGLDVSDVLDMEFLPTELAAYRLMPGDVLLSEASGSATEVGKPALWNGEIEDCCFQNTVVRFRSKIVNPRFALLAFSHFARNGIFSRASKGVGIHHLSADRFSALPFLLPPGPEQERIVARAEELFSDLDTGVAALKRAKANLRRYRASVLKAAIEGRLTASWRAEHRTKETGSQLLERILKERRCKWEAAQLGAFTAAQKEPPKNWQARYEEPLAPDISNLPNLPSGWAWATIEQLSLFARYGSSAKTSADIAGVPVLRMGNIVDGTIDFSDLKFLPAGHPEFPDLILQKGDLLFNRTNSAELVGKSAVYDSTEAPCSYASYLIAVRFVSGYCPELACYFLNSIHGRRWIKSVVSQQVGQANVNGTKLQALAVPVPTTEEQLQIVTQVEERLASLKQAEKQLDANLIRSSKLRQSILRQGFEGRLVAQSTSDEPAKELLARIQRQTAAIKIAEVAGGRESGKESRHQFFRRAAIVAYTVHRLGSNKSFGRTQLEKTLHLAQSHVGVDLDFEFERYAAGPFDKAIYKIEGAAKKNGWFTKQDRKNFGVTYHPGPKTDSMCKYAQGYLGSKQTAFDRLLDHIATMNTDEAELFATTYAAWNDLLIDGRKTDDATIIAEVHGWHESKAKFTPQAIRSRLKWMREQGYVPSGQGQRTRIIEKTTRLRSTRGRKRKVAR